jgi:hypothetical protein
MEEDNDKINDAGWENEIDEKIDLFEEGADVGLDDIPI